MANRIAEIRKARGLTQVELAQALHVNESTIVRWEKGYTDIPRNALLRLAKYLHVAPYELDTDLACIPDDAFEEPIDAPALS